MYALQPCSLENCRHTIQIDGTYGNYLLTVAAAQFTTYYNRRVSPFPLAVGVCTEPDAPFDGDSPVCVDIAALNTKRCSISCPAGKALLRSHPNVYSCGPAGIWRRKKVSPPKFRFPPCGGMSSWPSLRIEPSNCLFIMSFRLVVVSPTGMIMLLDTKGFKLNCR